MYRLNPIWPAGALTLGMALFAPVSLAAQEREVIANEIAVSGSEASLRLEFTDRGELSISFRDGVIAVDGQEIGRFERGDDVETAWRELLGQTLTLENGALVRALIDWAPPENLSRPE